MKLERRVHLALIGTKANLHNVQKPLDLNSHTLLLSVTSALQLRQCFCRRYCTGIRTSPAQPLSIKTTHLASGQQNLRGRDGILLASPSALQVGTNYHSRQGRQAPRAINSLSRNAVHLQRDLASKATACSSKTMEHQETEVQPLLIFSVLTIPSRKSRHGTP